MSNQNCHELARQVLHYAAEHDGQLPAWLDDLDEYTWDLVAAAVREMDQQEAA